MGQEKGPEVKNGGSGTLATARKPKKIVPLFQRSKLNPEAQAKKALNRDTTVLCIKNSVGPGEVDEDLKTDFHSECSKFGKILDIKLFDVSQLPNMEHVSDEDAVRIFVKYQSTQSSRQAFDALNGRFFAGRTLKCVFFGLKQFDTNDLAGDI